MGKRMLAFFRTDRLFSISLLLALIACFFGTFRWSFIDFKVILSLFGLMLVINGLEEAGLLRAFGQKLVEKSRNLRDLIRAIVLLSFFSSMFLTNDVAILTLLPIYLLLTRKEQQHTSVLLGAVYLIVAANLGSSLFPFGNPQNLFLFSYYQISLPQFMWTTGTFVGLSLLLLLVSIQLIPKTPLEIALQEEPFEKKPALLNAGLFVLMILGIFSVLPISIAVLVVAAVVWFSNKRLFAKVDYQLLLTFLCFFLIVGNIQDLSLVTDHIRPYFQETHRAFLGSILLSQGISNVPAAILIAPFTDLEKAVLLGVNVGGLGTLIASLANLIGYKLLKQARPKEARTFQKLFFIVNIIFLLLLGSIVYLLL
ncbi:MULTISPECIES: SLC13 family permease [unclassified Enterococcus]|uniref:SLC13 family permease n=1 Tax=unclassified Enterococcus TaxID=2608891 RepID=UPI00259B19E9|nr:MULTISPECIES: SLC13 family permease [unclassified Enterococcus]MDO0920551.1 SLC13 family permease [Enterococcus sp. B1E2]WIV14083.1 SLC13 family permease [Enterococcus sp. FZMF]